LALVDQQVRAKGAYLGRSRMSATSSEQIRRLDRSGFRGGYRLAADGTVSHFELMYEHPHHLDIVRIAPDRETRAYRIWSAWNAAQLFPVPTGTVVFDQVGDLITVTNALFALGPPPSLAEPGATPPTLPPVSSRTLAVDPDGGAP
jgi:hypothetical protein